MSFMMTIESSESELLFRNPTLYDALGGDAIRI